MKRILSIALALLLMLCTASFSSAAETVTLWSDPVTGSVGDTVTAYIMIDSSLTGQAKIVSMNMSVHFDSSAVQFIDIAYIEDKMESDFFAGMSSPMTNAPENESSFILAWATSNGSNAMGVLIGLQFKILNDKGSALSINDIDISYVPSQTGAMTDISMEPVILGGISVGSNPAPTPDPSTLVDSGPTVTDNTVTNVTFEPLADTPEPLDNSVIESFAPATDVPTDAALSSAEPSDDNYSATDAPTQTDEAGDPISDEPDGQQDAEQQGGGSSRTWIYIVGAVGIILIVGAAVTFVIQKKKNGYR